MYILYETEIKKLAKEAEAFVIHQRVMKSLFKDNSAYDKFIVPETGIGIAKYLLNNIYHLEGDVQRLSKQIDVNLSDMEWYNNL